MWLKLWAGTTRQRRKLGQMTAARLFAGVQRGMTSSGPRIINCVGSWHRWTIWTDFWSARGPSLHDHHTQSCQHHRITGVCRTVGKRHVLWGTTEPWPRVYQNQTRMGQICVSVYFRSIAANALEYSRGSSQHIHFRAVDECIQSS
jgi:hypothetical protein